MKNESPIKAEISLKNQIEFRNEGKVGLCCVHPILSVHLTSRDVDIQAGILPAKLQTLDRKAGLFFLNPEM